MVGQVDVSVLRLPHAQGLDLPSYGSAGAAGVDFVAALPVDETLSVLPGERVLVPTGLCIALPRGYELQLRPRSGLALKHGLTLPNTPGTIDEDYRGEVKIIVMNMGQENFLISRGMRIAQGVLAPVTRIVWRERAMLEETERGDKGFGSTGIHTIDTEREPT